MYAFIKGELISSEPDHTILETGGIGYLIYTPLSIYYQSYKKNSLIFLHTTFIVREDSMKLYGFEHLKDKTMFEELIKINGLGPKTAMAIISHSDTINLSEVIGKKDVATLVKIPGIGRKTAERMITELADKMDKIVSIPLTSPLIKDAIAALISLGYKDQEASKSVGKAFELAPPGTTLSDLISIALSSRK